MAAWILVEASGAVRGEVHLPARASVSWSDGGSAWVVEPDELDVPWLVRYRLGPAPGG